MLLACVCAAGCGWWEPLQHWEPFDHEDVAFLERRWSEIRANRERAGHVRESRPYVPQPLMPATDDEADRWPLALQKCVEIALAQNPNLQVVRLNPAIEAARVQNALAVFDAVLRGTANLSRTEEISTSVVSTGNIGSLFGGTGATTDTGTGTDMGTDGQDATGTTDKLESVTSESAEYRIEIEKPLETGGAFTISTGFQRQRTTNILVEPNPNYRPDVTFEFSHALLRGAGIEFNRSNIRIARLNHRLSVAQFEAEVMNLLQSVERAYWQLSFAYADLESRRKALERAEATLKKVDTKMQAGSASRPEVAQARRQFLQFKVDVLDAKDRLIRTDLELRRLMGIALDDRRVIYPADKPTTAPTVPVWTASLRQAMVYRPELAQQRIIMQSSLVALRAARNGLLPRLDFQALWRITGLGSNLDKAVEVLTENDFTDWQLGGTLEIPLGNRDAEATLRGAKLQSRQATLAMHDLEQRVKQEVLNAMRSVSTACAQIPFHEQKVDASKSRLEAAQAFYDEGRTTTDQLLEAEAELAEAERQLFLAVVTYNVALVNLELAKGTLLAYNNVVLAEVDEEIE